MKNYTPKNENIRKLIVYLKKQDKSEKPKEKKIHERITITTIV